MNKKIFAILADGFEELELIGVVDILKRLEIEVSLVSLTSNQEVTGAHDIKIVADQNLEDLDLSIYDGVYLPGGMPGSLNLYNSDKVIEVIQKFNHDHRLVAAICAAPMVLSKANIIKDRAFTMYPGMEEYLQGELPSNNLVETSENMITGRGPGAAIPLALEIGKYFWLNKEIEFLKQAMFL